MPFCDTPSIETIKLSKRYNSFTALSELSLKIEGAKCVGFLGPNGAGKTTTLKMLTDLVYPSSGEALINGITVHTNKKKALKSVGTLIETPEIYPSLTPREALTMIARLRGVPTAEIPERIEEAVSEVHMDDWLDKRVGKFSKGMKQRICIASALVNNPCILLLDEPTSGLDPRGMSEVRDIIKSLKAKKRLIFMSSHILSEVSEVCDQVALIDHGKLIVYDTIPNVTSKFSGGANIVEIGLKRSLNSQLATQNIAKLPEVLSMGQIDDRNLRIKFNGGLDAQEMILANLVSLKIGVVTCKSSSSELEDVYLKLIKETVQ
jgi:ABC-2 type transport system ATP-binding protein